MGVGGAIRPGGLVRFLAAVVAAGLVAAGCDGGGGGGPGPIPQTAEDYTLVT